MEKCLLIINYKLELYKINILMCTMHMQIYQSYIYKRLILYVSSGYHPP